jgi:hypothetical protein
MRLNPFDIFLPVVIAMVFLALGWASLRPLWVGRPLPTHMKKALSYGFLLVLGGCYLMLIGARLNWPHTAILAAIGAWFVLLAAIAWWRYRQKRTPPATPRKPVSTVFAEGTPALALLICVVAGAVEWEYIFKGQGRWWVGLLWLAGVAASILAARHNRRTTVIFVLRGVVALLVIGAISQWTSAAFIAAAISGLALLLLEKFWRSNPDGR